MVVCCAQFRLGAVDLLGSCDDIMDRFLKMDDENFYYRINSYDSLLEEYNQIMKIFF